MCLILFWDNSQFSYCKNCVCDPCWGNFFHFILLVLENINKYFRQTGAMFWHLNKHCQSWQWECASCIHSWQWECASCIHFGIIYITIICLSMHLYFILHLSVLLISVLSFDITESGSSAAQILICWKIRRRIFSYL